MFLHPRIEAEEDSCRGDASASDQFAAFSRSQKKPNRWVGFRRSRVARDERKHAAGQASRENKMMTYDAARQTHARINRGASSRSSPLPRRSFPHVVLLFAQGCRVSKAYKVLTFCVRINMERKYQFDRHLAKARIINIANARSMKPSRILR